MPESYASLIKAALFLIGLAVFLVIELFASYRPPTVSKMKRWLINLALTGFNNIFLSLAFASATAMTLAYVAASQTGLLNIISLPYWAKALAIVLVMDFITYIWHLLNHEVPFFWRFHRVHHSDLNMDASTATRFHIGELAISGLIRLSLIYFLGADLLSLLIFETLSVLAIQFHHSSIKVPKWFERIFWIFFVPPSMHRIHHSVKIKERDSNYGVIFSFWDRMLGTMAQNVDQAGIRIGMGAYTKQEKLNFHHLLVMPFTKAVK